MHTTPSPIQQIYDPIFTAFGIEVFIKRDDLLHPFVSGNKWRKLKYNLLEMRQSNKDTVISFGGAYSNHIYSLAATGKLLGFKTIGFIRGEETFPLNSTLSFAKDCGMKIFYMSREEYRTKEDPAFLSRVEKDFNYPYMLPEGGTNSLAVKGCEEITQEITMDFDFICCPCGSGGTISGIAKTLREGQHALGFSVLKGLDTLTETVALLSGIFPGNNWEINNEYHFGGYARDNAELINFIKDFKIKFSIPLEQVYTGKMMFGLFDLIKKGYFPHGSRVIALHTGGLQGIKAELKE